MLLIFATGLVHRGIDSDWLMRFTHSLTLPSGGVYRGGVRAGAAGLPGQGLEGAGAAVRGRLRCLPAHCVLGAGVASLAAVTGVGPLCIWSRSAQTAHVL